MFWILTAIEKNNSFYLNGKTQNRAPKGGMEALTAAMVNFCPAKIVPILSKIICQYNEIVNVCHQTVKYIVHIINAQSAINLVHMVLLYSAIKTA